MAEWWQISEEQIAADPEAAEERAWDFFQTFYGDESGQKVYAYFKRKVAELNTVEMKNVTESEQAIICRANENFLNLIRANCGIVNELEIVRAEADIAVRGMETRKKKETKKPETIYD